METRKYITRIYKNVKRGPLFGMWSVQLRKADLGLEGSGWKVAFHVSAASMSDAVQVINSSAPARIVKNNSKEVYAKFQGTVELPVELVENWTEAIVIALVATDHRAIDQRFRVTINPKDANPTLASNFHIANSDILVTDSPSLQFCSNSQCYLA
jgi:hypothetical protein